MIDKRARKVRKLIDKMENCKVHVRFDGGPTIAGKLFSTKKLVRNCQG